MSSETGGPFVSIVMPTYNRAKYLKRSIDSVLNQTHANFEFIVVDDCSKDDTDALMAGYDDPRLVYVRHEKNKGASAARNTGIRAAKADYVAFQDSDDEWLPQKLEKQMNVFVQQPQDVGVVYCDLYFIKPDGETTVWDIPHIMPEDGIIYDKALDDGLLGLSTQLLVVRRECFDNVGMFDESIGKLLDLELLVRLSSAYKFYHVAEPLVNYYVTPGNITSKGEGAGLRAYKAMFEKHQEQLKKNKPLLAKRAYWIGSFQTRDGDAAGGRKYLRQALAACPTNPRYLVAYAASFLGSGAYGAVNRLLRKMR